MAVTTTTNAAMVYGDLFEKCMLSTLKVAERLPEANHFRVLQEGKAHPLWLLGHITNTHHFLLHMTCFGHTPILSKEWAKRFSPDFAGGDPIVSDSAAYPAWDEIVEKYRTVAETCIASIRNLQDDEIAGDFKGKANDFVKTAFGNVEGTIRHMIHHDAHHGGQIALIGALK